MGRQSRTKRERRQRRRTIIPEPIASPTVAPEPERPAERTPTEVTADEIRADIRKMVAALESFARPRRRRTVASARLIPRLALQALCDAPGEER